jgi:hypothetical protein
LRDEKRRRFAALLGQSVYTERPNTLLVDEETPLPSSDRGDTQTDRSSHKLILGKQAKSDRTEITFIED